MGFTFQPVSHEPGISLLRFSSNFHDLLVLIKEGIPKNFSFIDFFVSILWSFENFSTPSSFQFWGFSQFLGPNYFKSLLLNTFKILLSYHTQESLVITTKHKFCVYSKFFLMSCSKWKNHPNSDPQGGRFDNFRDFEVFLFFKNSFFIFHLLDTASRLYNSCQECEMRILKIIFLAQQCPKNEKLSFSEKIAECFFDFRSLKSFKDLFEVYQAIHILKVLIITKHVLSRVNTQYIFVTIKCNNNKLSCICNLFFVENQKFELNSKY